MLKKYIREGSFLWLGLVLFIALCIAFLLPVTPEDYWWYVRWGSKPCPPGNPGRRHFHLLRFGQAIYYHSWGASVFFWLVYKAGGLNLTILLRGLIVGITYTLVWFTARRSGAGRIGSSLVLLTGIFGIKQQLAGAPAITGLSLIRRRYLDSLPWQNGSKRAVWWLPLIALIWGNLHASFVLLIILVGAALVFGKGNRKTLLLAFLGILVALFINPRGWQTWQYVYQSLTVPSNQLFSMEWMPPIIRAGK